MFSFIIQAEHRKKDRKKERKKEEGKKASQTDRLMQHNFLVVGMEDLHCNTSEDFICSYF